MLFVNREGHEEPFDQEKVCNSLQSANMYCYCSHRLSQKSSVRLT